MTNRNAENPSILQKLKKIAQNKYIILMTSLSLLQACDNTIDQYHIVNS